MKSNRQSKPQITISTIAQHAKVSRVAVYAAFHPEKQTTVGISEKTREKILAASKELGYVPNDLAKTLVSGRSKTIGLLLKDNSSPLLHRLISACSNLFHGHDYLLISEFSAGDSQRERDILTRFLVKRVDCVIVAWFDYENNKVVAEQFNQCGIPVISIHDKPVVAEGSATVYFDEPRGMHLISDFLHRKGLHRVCYAGCESRRSSSSFRRLEYLTKALQEIPEMQLTESVTFADAEDCRRFVAQLKKRKEKPDVIVCYNDRIAQLVAVELKIAGFRIPEEISVTGVDGYGSPYDPVKLTTVQLPVEEMAKTIFELFQNSDFHGQFIPIFPRLLEQSTTP